MIKFVDYKLKIINSQGSSLIELVLYMGIFSILLIVLFQTFSSILDVQLESESASSTTQDAKYILSRLDHDIQQAQNIVTPNTLGGQGPTLHITSSTTDYTYSLSGSNLILTNNNTSTSDQLNSSDTTITSVNFLRLGSSLSSKNSIQITFTIQSKAQKRSGVTTQSFQTTIQQR